MNTVETDVKFTFSPGAFMTTSLDGHAAYQLDNGKANVRVVAVGPLGALSMDLLIRNGDFRVEATRDMISHSARAICLRFTGTIPQSEHPRYWRVCPVFFLGDTRRHR